jgi:hypothetical protein
MEENKKKTKKVQIWVKAEIESAIVKFSNEYYLGNKSKFMTCAAMEMINRHSGTETGDSNNFAAIEKALTSINKKVARRRAEFESFQAEFEDFKEEIRTEFKEIKDLCLNINRNYQLNREEEGENK